MAGNEVKKPIKYDKNKQLNDQEASQSNDSIMEHGPLEGSPRAKHHDQ